MQIKNIEGLTVGDVNREVQNGAKFVIFEYAVSILVMSFKRPSDIYFIKAGESHWGKSIGFTLVSFVFGWWGIPWGFVYTPMALYTNLSGGKDVTREVLNSINSKS